MGAFLPDYFKCLSTPAKIDVNTENCPISARFTVLKQLFHGHDNRNERVVKPISRMLKKNADVIRLSDLGFPEGWEKLIAFTDC